jgi:DNA polymerase (family X)
METNEEIAKIFSDMADILEIEDVEWKPRAYREGARSLRVLGQDLGDLYRKGGLKALEEIPGIGEGLGKKIVEYLQTGKIGEYERLKKTLPSGVRELLKVPGLGPYRAENLYHHHIGSVEDLKRAIRDHRLADIPGFGEKSEEKIAGNLGLPRPHGERWSRAEVIPWARKVLSALGKLVAVERLELVGSLRRQAETIGDIDILAISSRPEEVMEAFTAMPQVEKVLLHGNKKSEVLLKCGLQVDLRVFEKECFGAAMIYFTGSKQHNIELRRIAIHKGYKLNEYGLFDRKGRTVAGRTEEEVYEKLGFRFIPPERRLDRGEFEAFRLEGV